MNVNVLKVHIRKNNGFFKHLKRVHTQRACPKFSSNKNESFILIELQNKITQRIPKKKKHFSDETYY